MTKQRNSAEERKKEFIRSGSGAGTGCSSEFRSVRVPVAVVPAVVAAVRFEAVPLLPRVADIVVPLPLMLQS